VDFEETIAAIESLSGTVVDVTVLGATEDRSPMADLRGVLSRMAEPVGLPSLPEDTECAVIFCIGEDNHLTIWPGRFIEAKRPPHTRAIEIKTRDGVYLVGPKSRAWID